MNRKFKNGLYFLAFCGPAVLIFAFVIGAAFVNGIFVTFTDWNGLSDSYQMIGFANYIEAFKDAEFFAAFGRTIIYVIAVVVITNIIAFLVAYALTRGQKGQNVFRAGFFTPNLIGGVILGIVWRFIFMQAVTQVGKAMGSSVLSKNMLSQNKTAMLALVIVAVWQLAGYLMLIYMAGIIAVPKDVMEAAQLDGAVGFQKLKSIVIPLIMPSITICGFMALKTAFMAYDVNLTLTGGGPVGTTELVAMHVYNKAFVSEQYGVGQTQALILFFVVAVVTVLQVSFTKNKEVEA